MTHMSHTFSSCGAVVLQGNGAADAVETCSAHGNVQICTPPDNRHGEAWVLSATVCGAAAMQG